MTDPQVAEFLTKSLGYQCRIARGTDHFDLFIDSLPKLSISFGLVKDFHSLAAVTPMLAACIKDYIAEREAYLKTKTQKRGPYRKRKKRL